VTRQHIIEKDVKKGVKIILEKHKWFWWMPPANGFGKSGISDFHAIRHGVFIAIETKVGKAKPTEMQRGFLSSIQAEGGFALVVNEERLPTLDMMLTAFDDSVELAQHQKEDPDIAALLFNTIRQLSWEIV
jgi:hypothetical protein